MAIDTIDELDNLNTGRVKLNQAIDQANTVQGQLDTIVIASGTSDAETIQARGGEPLLYNRLDKVDTQLAQKTTVINVHTFTTIQLAIDKAIEVKNTGANPTLLFSYLGNYETTGTTYIPSGINVMMEKNIVYTGTENITVLVVGEASNVNKRVKLWLSVNRQTNPNWENENSIGVKVVNAYESDIVIAQSERSTIGVQFMGDTKGCVYNNVRLFSLGSNKIGVDVTSDFGGWTNENIYHGGRFWNPSTLNIGKSRYGVRVTSKDDYEQNNNVFIKPSFELGSAQANPGEALPVLIEYGVQNTFKECRHEGNGAVFARVINTSSENQFSLGYSPVTSTIEDFSIFPASLLTYNRKLMTQIKGTSIFNTRDLHKRACLYNGTTQVHVPYCHQGSSVASTLLKARTGIVINENYLEIPSTISLGVFVNTEKRKRFIVRRDTIPNFSGRIGVRCYDVNGNILTSADSNHPYVKGNSYLVPAYNSGFGGIYRTGVDNDADVYFTVHDDVKQIVVLVISVTASTYLKGFTIESIDGFCATWSGYEEIIPGANLGITPPTTGVWERGKIVWNDTPSIGSPRGWRKITTGSNNVLGTDWEVI